LSLENDFGLAGIEAEEKDSGIARYLAGEFLDQYRKDASIIEFLKI
jgi:hypothetical protein